MRNTITTTMTPSAIPTAVPSLGQGLELRRVGPRRGEQRDLPAERGRVDEEPERDRGDVEHESRRQPELREFEVSHPHHEQPGDEQ
jgi:hypothetical protein